MVVYSVWYIQNVYTNYTKQMRKVKAYFDFTGLALRVMHVAEILNEGVDG